MGLIALERIFVLDDFTLEVLDVLGFYVWDKDQRLELEFETYTEIIMTFFIFANYYAFTGILCTWTAIMKTGDENH